jgi:histidinol-phosphatase (PHP family)
VIDYHLHLWPHGEASQAPTLDQLAAYCDAAAAAGVTEIALTEHLFRFAQADAALAGFWEDDTGNPHLQEQAAEYWREHVGADLDEYVTVVEEAKAAGLPVVLGLEVDHYAGRMDKVQALLEGYPFDVLLGSVHWIGAWLFDVIESSVAQAEWDRRGLEGCWGAYVEALEELAGSGAVDVLAHPDLCKVAARVPEVPDEFHDRIAEAAAAAGLAAEVSSAGWRKPCAEAYPAPALLRRFRERGVPVTTASDAHSVDLVAHRSADLRPLLESAGYDQLVAFRARRPRPVAL